MTEESKIVWLEDGEARSAHWRSESGARPPKRVVVADDTMPADTAYRLACEGTALLWRGDFNNARLLLQAIARRIDRKPAKAGKGGKAGKAANAARKAARAAAAPVGEQAAVTAAPGTSPGTAAASGTMPEAFHLHRQAQAQRARTLGMLLVPFDADYRIPLRRAPDIREACEEAYGPPDGEFVASLREVQGLVGAHEWRKKGVPIPALGAHIHPHYGVFSPVRGEYVALVAQAPLPPGASELAFDIGTGSGVLAAVLARRGVRCVVATDQDARALACARENVARLGLGRQVEVVEADLFPEGRAPLVVCNPPWVPARPSSPVEHAVYDPESRMLRGFLGGLAAHLAPQGEGWLILSDLAEHLRLRSRDDFLAMVEAAGLTVVGRLDARPQHPRASDADDPLHAARAAEVTSLWRLAAR
ncbi:class I SAM-dependent methyltransferase [Aromatoleum sp.]|uniref:class I SAM-dependent methyltransferase n=1 Tax=Aromatoleum sp. TaxID=2307007 RepID=UPI002FC90D45